MSIIASRGGRVAADIVIDLWEISNASAVRATVEELLDDAGFEVNGPRITIDEFDGRLMRIDARTYTGADGILGREWAELLLSRVHGADPSAGGRVEVFNLDRTPDATAERS
jgi:hypothetical protein